MKACLKIFQKVSFEMEVKNVYRHRHCSNRYCSISTLFSLENLRPLHESVKAPRLGQFPFFNLNALIPEWFSLKNPSFWQTYANNRTISFRSPAFTYFLAQLS